MKNFCGLQKIFSVMATAFLLLTLPGLDLQASCKTSTDSASYKGTEANKGTGYSVGFQTLSADYPYKDQPIPFKIAIWYPTTKKAGSYSYKIGASTIKSTMATNAPMAVGSFPIVFYSHGATGAGTSSFFICETLARHGYIVAAPDFLDLVSVARIDQSVPYDGLIRMRTNQYIASLREFGLNKAARESRVLYSYRPEQLKQTMQLVLSKNAEHKSNLYQHIDESKIGLFGHSFGAWTSLLLAGAAPSIADSRIKAVAALSGPVNERIFAVASDNDFNTINVPVLFEYGEKEPATGRLDDKALLFDKAKAPKILIAIKDADHLSFSGGVKGEHKRASEYLEKDIDRKTIAETTLDFFNAFLKGDSSGKDRLKNRTEGVASSAATFE